jgi:hypothetical protein
MFGGVRGKANPADVERLEMLLEAYKRSIAIPPGRSQHWEVECQHSGEALRV